MAKLKQTLSYKVAAKAMLYGYLWQRAFICSAILNLILIVILVVNTI